MCLSAFPGARAVCAGSEEARALIKEQAWYRDASLTALGDVQPDGVQMRATRLDFFPQTSEESLCPLPSPLSSNSRVWAKKNKQKKLNLLD